MPELEAALAEIRRLADRPPVHPPPVSAVAARAGRRRRHRRMVVVVGSAASLVIIALAIVAATQTRPGAQRVRTSGNGASPLPGANSTTTATVTTGGPGAPITAPAASRGLTLEPATGLTDGSRVKLHLAPSSAGGIIVAQCSAEGLRYLGTGDQSAVLNWCTIVSSLGPPIDSAGSLVVRRALRTQVGIIDCAAAPRRCVVAVRLGGIGGTDDRFAPLTFDPHLSPLPVPSVRLGGVHGPIADPQRVTVSGHGFRPGAIIDVVECIGSPGNVPDGGSCDATRDRSLRADAAGRIRGAAFVFNDVQLQRGERLVPWRRCEPCTLRVQGEDISPIDFRVDIPVSSTSVHPEVRIIDPGPYRTDQRVRLEGSGFQVDQKVQVFWCRLDNPLQDCATPAEALFALKADAAGRLTVPSFPMPPRRFGAYGSTCLGPTARCGLAWYPAEGVPAAFVTPFQMVP